MRTACHSAGSHLIFIRLLIGWIKVSRVASRNDASSRLRYQCQPVGNAFQALKLCGPHITDQTLDLKPGHFIRWSG
jgi:hypothetical protein